MGVPLKFEISYNTDTKDYPQLDLPVKTLPSGKKVFVKTRGHSGEGYNGDGKNGENG